ncbi:MAG: hypothetical protein U1A81_20230 [Hydrogenophaga sp.]|nr:hypothetical protein [Hydrogenophaga sp.]
MADCTGVLGFECRQHIPGVLAVVVHGPMPAHRLPAEALALQPWGARAFAFADIDGQGIHCVDWSVRRPSPDASFNNPRTGGTE